MKVVKMEPYKAPEVIEIENTLDAMQEVVGGYIEIIPFIIPGVLVVLNEEGKLRGLEPNFALRGDTIVGTVFFCREDGEDLTDLTEDDIRKIKNYF